MKLSAFFRTYSFTKSWGDSLLTTMISRNSRRRREENIMRFNRFLFLSILCIFVFFSANTEAEDAESYSWENSPSHDFYCKRLVKCVTLSGEWDHSLYYYNDKEGNKCLVLLCHGFVDRFGNFGIVLHNVPRYDCANAVSETLAYWSQKGFLNSDKGEGYDYVFLNSCYIGRMPQTLKLPLFDINLVKSMTHEGVTGHVETVENDGRIRLRLYLGYPKPLGTRKETAPPKGIVVDTTRKFHSN